MPVPYWLLRALVFAVGLLIIVVGAVTLLVPSFSSEPSGYGSSVYGVQGVLAALAALSYAVPNRWSTRGLVFWLRLAVMVVFGLYSSFTAAQLIAGAFDPKHWLLYPVLAPLLCGVITAPILLLWRRRSEATASPASPAPSAFKLNGRAHR